MKHSLRIALLLTAGSLLRITIALFIFLATLFSLFFNRGYIFSLLESTNSYERLPLVILNASSTQQLGQNEATQLGSEQFAPIVLDSAPPEVAKLAAQKIVNAHYDWLQGDAESVEFQIDLASSKEAIINGITSYALNRYETLRPCDEIISGYDFFSVPCKIDGLDLEAQEESLRSQLENTPLLLRDTQYTEESLLTDTAGRSLDEFAPWLEGIYRNFSSILLFLFMLIVVFIVINFLGATSIVKGIRRVGKLIFQGSSGFLLTAIVLLVLLPFFGFGLTATPPNTDLTWQNQTYDSLFNDLIGKVARDFILRGLLFSIPFVLIGAASWLFGSYQLEKQRHTGASFATKLINTTLENTGLVSSEKEKSHTKKIKRKLQDTDLPIASSENTAIHKRQKGKRTRTRKNRRNKSK